MSDEEAIQRELDEARRVRDTGSSLSGIWFGDKMPHESFPAPTVHRDNLFGFLIDDETMDIIDRDLKAVLERGPKREMVKEYAMGSLTIIDPADREALVRWYDEVIDKESFKHIQE